MGRRVELTWWIPRTACLVQVGVGRSCSRIPPWIACKTPQARQKILETLTSSRGHAQLKSPSFPQPAHLFTQTHRQGSIWFEAGCAQMALIKKMSAPITQLAECVLHTPIWQTGHTCQYGVGGETNSETLAMPADTCEGCTHACTTHPPVRHKLRVERTKSQSDLRKSFSL